MYYNVKVKTFSDGTRQYSYYEHCREKDYKQEKKGKSGENVERKEEDNEKRARSAIYDLARNNDFEWFITLTFSPEQVDRYDYYAVANLLKEFTKSLLYYGCQWLIVPDVHEDGAYHFHGLVRGGLPVVESGHFDNDGRVVYNIKNYEYGFSTATRISDKKRVSSYITKYMTKKLSIPKGKKRYWASRGLQRPKEDFLEMTSEEFGEIYNQARFQKDTDSPWGHYILCEE